MTRTQYLLICLMEEAAEVQQRASKALRFGLDEIQPGQELSNEQRLIGEMHDFAAVASMLAVEGIVKPDKEGGENASQAKRKKVEKFMRYSLDLGVLDKGA